MQSQLVVKNRIATTLALSCIQDAINAVKLIWLGYNPNSTNPACSIPTVLNQEDISDLDSSILFLRNQTATQFHRYLLTPDSDGCVQAAEAALFTSHIHDGSGSLFNCDPINYNVDHNIFREMLRVRMLINPLFTYTNDINSLMAVDGDVPITCSCGHRVTTYGDGFHVLTCTQNQAIRTKRHTVIKNLIHQLLATVLPRSATFQVEPAITVEGRTRKGDLLIDDRTHNLRQVIDFVISDPTSQGCLAHRSFDDPEAVTAIAENGKLDSYNKVPWLQQGIFCPFAITSTGKLGEAAMSFLKRVKSTYELKDSFITDVQAKVERSCLFSLAAMLVTSRFKYRLGMISFG
jgi:hypothetical protein